MAERDRLLLKSTREILIDTFTDSICSANEVTVNDIVSMEGNKFFIGKANKGVLISKLVQLQNAGHYRISLVPIAADNTIFFADVDVTPNGFDLDFFLNMVCHHFNQLASRKKKNVHKDDLIIFKKESDNRYHVYISAEWGEVSKVERKSIWNAVNNNFFAKKVIDTSASTIRFEGFLKFDNKVTNTWEPASRYLPMRDGKIECSI